MFKYKIIKYFLISSLILFIFIFIAILRLSYKPLDISYFSSIYPILNKQFSELYDIKSEKVYLNLNVLKNEASLKVDNIIIQNINSKISNVKAKEAHISLKISNILRNKIEADNITIRQGGLDIYDLKEFSQVNKFATYNKKYKFNNIMLEKININIYENDNKVGLLTNLNLALTQSKESIFVDDLSINNLVLKSFNTKDYLTLNNLKLIKKNRTSYTFKIKNIELTNKDIFLKNKYFKNINDFFLEDIKLDFNTLSYLTKARGKIFINDYSNKFTVNAIFRGISKFDGDLNLNLENFPIFTLLKNNIYEENKYKIDNISSALFNGSITATFKDSVLEKTEIKVFSKLNESKVFLTNLKNNLQINVEDISLEGQFNKKVYEIKNLNINKYNQNLKIKGKFYDDFKRFFLKINADKIEYNKINNFLNNSLDTNLKYSDEISSINIEQIQNIKFTLSKFNNNIQLNIDNSDFKNIKLITRKKIIFNISSAKLIKKNKDIKLYSSNISIEGFLGDSNFSSLSVFTGDYSNIKNNIQLKSNISTNYKFLNYLLSELNINQNLPQNLKGQLSGFLSISKGKKDKNLKYFFEGKLENFDNIRVDNQEMPLDLNEFNGKVFLSNEITRIEGNGSINGSSSDIKILVENDNILTATIEAQAKPSSFNFLGKYNFIKQGNSKLKISITKNINSRKWKADFDANLFSNEIEINFINFQKSINRRGSVSGTLYFDGLDLVKVDKLDFLTEQLLVSANLLFKNGSELESILIERYIKDKNNFKANIQFLESNINLVQIGGDSIDFKSLMSFGTGEENNMTLTLNVDNVYYDSIYFGNTFIEGQIKNNQLLKLKGNISNNKTAYIRFANSFDKQSEYNKINIEFDDFGYFLKKSSLSESFLKGDGIATLYLKNLKLINGKLQINNSSIKNSSFLARLLQLASFTGLLEILTNEGIPFDRIVANFTKKDNIINIEEARFQGFSLGGNLKGITEIDKQEISLEGIIVPAYAINSFLNKIPLIGQVITGIEGDGLIGVNFQVKGTYEEPNYNVNPLSILTPGILRSIFDSLFDVEYEEEIIE